MGAKHEEIAAFHDAIVSLRAQSATWRAIAQILANQGLAVDHNALVRYAKKVRLPTESASPVVEPKAPPAPPIQTPMMDGIGVTQQATDASRHGCVSNDEESRRPTRRGADRSGGVAPSALSDASPEEVPVERPWLPAAAPRVAESVASADLLTAIEFVERATLTTNPATLQVSIRRLFQARADKAIQVHAELLRRIDAAIVGLERLLDEPLMGIGRSGTPSPSNTAGSPNTNAQTPSARNTLPEGVIGPSRSHPLFTAMWRAPVWDMSEPLLHFGGEENAWTLQDACEGTLILGATGSGKTSGSGALVSKACLSGCFGGIVLTAKEDEAVHWQRAAEQLGRSEQICLVQPGGPFKFNFLDYQTKLPESQGGSVENTVELFHAILESYSRNKRKADSFWANTSKQLLRNLVRIIRGARVNFDLMVIRAFLSEVPPDATVAATGAWKTSPTFGRLIGNARVLSRGTPDERFVDEAARYWTVDLPNLADKTRSIVVMDLVSMLDLFFDPAVWDLFCGETTITPEAVFDGAILVIDLPIKKYLSIGRIAQIIWKHLFQLAVERRSDPNDSTRRPVFLWADEAQNFWSDSDGLFQATARSSRCATVYLTQNIPGFYAQVGGELARERVDGFLANLCTKIFHNNNDPATNHWAAEQLGKSMQYRASISSGEEPSPASFLSKGIGGFFEMLSGHRLSRVSTNPVLDFEVQPSAFAKLRTGSAKHRGLVDAYIVKSGSSFGATGKHYLKAIFQQEQAT